MYSKVSEGNWTVEDHSTFSDFCHLYFFAKMLCRPFLAIRLILFYIITEAIRKKKKKPALNEEPEEKKKKLKNLPMVGTRE